MTGSQKKLRVKPDVDGGNDNTREMLQTEKLIDPGNEHSHNVDDKQKPVENKEASADADAPPY